MADRKTEKRGWTVNEVASNFEQTELQLLQAQSVAQLEPALQSFAGDLVGKQNLFQMYELAGPARVVSLALRGYELPDAKARALSARALLNIDTILRQVDRRGELSEQIWLILAAQQDVLLQQIENDLEALFDAEDNADVLEQRAVLGRAHAVLRKRAAIAVDEMLAVGKYA